jgi:hypothetical protein
MTSKNRRNIYMSDEEDKIYESIEEDRIKELEEYFEKNNKNKCKINNLIIIFCHIDKYTFYKVNSLLVNLFRKNKNNYFSIVYYLENDENVKTFFNIINVIELNKESLKNIRIYTLHNNIPSKIRIDCKSMLNIYNSYKVKYENVIGLLIDEEDTEFMKCCNDSNYLFKFDINKPDVCPKYGKVDGFLKLYANKN